MLNKRIKNKKVLKKVIASLLISLTLLGVFTMFIQSDKISELEHDLYVKEQIVERQSDYTESTMYSKSIETKFNELQEYKIFDSTINFKHSYNFDEEFILGLHKKSKLTATCDVYYECDVRLSQADISENDNEIKIVLPTPFVKEESVHRVKDTMYVIEDETDSNLLCGNNSGMKVQKFWEDSIDSKAYNDIKDYYEIDDKVEYLKANAEKEVKSLVKTLNNNDKKVIIEFK